jgi:hypothetical protein
MACRCSEIQKCEQDIQLLSSVTSSLIKELRIIQVQNRHWMSKILDLSQDLADVIFVANRTRIETRLAAIKQNQEKRVNAADAKRLSESTRMNNKLDLYEKEDERYHKMMEQRARV